MLFAEYDQLSQLIKSLSEGIKKRKDEIARLFELEIERQDLARKVGVTKAYLESLQASQQKIALQEGETELNEHIQMSKAVPPLAPSSPNIRLTFAINFVIAVFVGVVFILLSSIFRKKFTPPIS